MAIFVAIVFVLFGIFERVKAHLASTMIALGLHHNVRRVDTPAVATAMRIRSFGSGLQVVEKACTAKE